MADDPLARSPVFLCPIRKSSTNPFPAAIPLAVRSPYLNCWDFTTNGMTIGEVNNSACQPHSTTNNACYIPPLDVNPTFSCFFGPGDSCAYNCGRFYPWGRLQEGGFLGLAAWGSLLYPPCLRSPGSFPHGYYLGDRSSCRCQTSRLLLGLPVAIGPAVWC